jgi:hypothetical protein
MATADQLKALIKSFSEQDSTRFYRVALQLAAHEARLGHGKVAMELRELIDKVRAAWRLLLSHSIPMEAYLFCFAFVFRAVVNLP